MNPFGLSETPGTSHPATQSHALEEWSLEDHVFGKNAIQLKRLHFAGPNVSDLSVSSRNFFL
jgi:hypothetical protein